MNIKIPAQAELGRGTRAFEFNVTNEHSDP